MKNKTIVVLISLLLLGLALVPSVNSVTTNNTEYKPGSSDSTEVTYDVYFGTTNPPPKVVTNQSETTYDPGTLQNNTVYYWKIVAWNYMGESSEGPVWHFTTEAGLPSVETLDAELIGKTNATLKGKIIVDGGDPCSIRFRYRIEGETEWIYPSDWHGSYETDETFSEYVDGLETSTIYEFEAGAKNSAGEVWGDLKNFTTGDNQLPVAVIDAPSLADKKTTIEFDGSDSYDPDGYITNYEWDFDDGDTDTGMVVTHSYQNSGIYSVSLEVTDDTGAVNDTTHDITINNNAPIASFVADNYEIEPGDTVNFDASSSSDPDGDTLTYSWDFGDGGSGSGVTESHTYTESGTFTVILMVTDDDGNNPLSDAYTAEIYVNEPPIADAGPDQEVDLFTGMPVEFDGSGSYDPDGTIVEYFWDFDDGETGYGMTIDHSYSTNGEFTVTLTVTDDHGATDDDTCIITVLLGKGQIEFTRADSKQEIAAKASTSVPPNTPSNPYPQDGATDVPLDVVLSWTSGQNHRPETTRIIGPESGSAGTPVEYKFLCTDPDGDQLYYFVDWGDHTVEEWIGPYNSGEEAAVSHTWQEQGVYVIGAVARDVYGLEGEWFQIEVTMPRSKTISLPILKLLQDYLDQFPILAKLLQRLIS